MVKIEFLIKNRTFGQTRRLGKNRNVLFVKNRNFGENRNLVQKSK